MLFTSHSLQELQWLILYANSVSACGKSDSQKRVVFFRRRNLLRLSLTCDRLICICTVYSSQGESRFNRHNANQLSAWDLDFCRKWRAVERTRRVCRLAAKRGEGGTELDRISLRSSAWIPPWTQSTPWSLPALLSQWLVLTPSRGELIDWTAIWFGPTFHWDIHKGSL